MCASVQVYSMHLNKMETTYCSCMNICIQDNRECVSPTASSRAILCLKTAIPLLLEAHAQDRCLKTGKARIIMCIQTGSGHTKVSHHKTSLYKSRHGALLQAVHNFFKQSSSLPVLSTTTVSTAGTSNTSEPLTVIKVCYTARGQKRKREGGDRSSGLFTPIALQKVAWCFHALFCICNKQSKLIMMIFLKQVCLHSLISAKHNLKLV